MGTRSTIGILNDDGSITGIYCHWDGYPEYVGKILLNHYTNPSVINELMNLGDLSSLGENVYPTESHTYDNPQKKVCVAYGRDRGETDTNSHTFDAPGDGYEQWGSKIGADYQYLFSNDKWLFRNHNSVWKELTPADCV